MALSDNIDSILDNTQHLILIQDRILKETSALADRAEDISNKIDRIKSNGNENTQANRISLEELKELIRFLADNWRVDAIKEIRRLTGCGLKEAKDLVEMFDVTYA